MPDIINIETERERRNDAEIFANEDRWEDIRDQLAEFMETSGLSQSALVSAALSA